MVMVSGRDFSDMILTCTEKWTNGQVNLEYSTYLTFEYRDKATHIFFLLHLYRTAVYKQPYNMLV